MGDTTKTAFNLRLPEDVVKQVDARAERLGISRNQWYENMTKWVLTHTELIQRRNGTP